MSRAIIIIGLPGAGKSTLASRVSEVIDNSTILSNDTIRAELDYPLTGHRYTKSVYSNVLERMKNCLSDGITPILDSTYYKRIFRLNLFQALAQLEKSATVIEVVTPINICLNRIKTRSSAGMSKIGGVDDAKKFFELVEKTETFIIDELPPFVDYFGLDASEKYLVVETTYQIQSATINLIKEIINR